MCYRTMTDEERERYDYEDDRADRLEARAIAAEESGAVVVQATADPIEELRRLGGRYEFMSNEELQAVLDYEDEIEFEESEDE